MESLERAKRSLDKAQALCAGLIGDLVAMPCADNSNEDM